MLDIFGNDTASSVNELHMSKLDDNIQTDMMDKLGAKIEVDETLIGHNTAVGSKIWDLETTISSLPLVSVGSKIWDLGTKIPSFPPISVGSKIWDLGTTTPKNNEAPEERNNGKERSTHTSQDNSGDGSSWGRDDEGRTIHKSKDGSYEVFKSNGCADFYDSKGNFLDTVC